jgi:hypothetical protein
MLLVIAVAVLGNSQVMVKVPNLLGMEERPARILLPRRGYAPMWSACRMNCLSGSSAGRGRDRAWR